jgi:hypothetical protein
VTGLLVVVGFSSCSNRIFSRHTSSRIRIAVLICTLLTVIFSPMRN